MNAFIPLYSLLLTFSLFAMDAAAQNKETPSLLKVADKPNIAQRAITINGKTLSYTVTSGYLSLKTETGENEAHIFYIAYTRDNSPDKARRPITFSFNGGPGSSSVWLHLGVLGPRRVLMTEQGESLPPPFQLVDNEYTWLEETDLVFIDPVTTGFSRAADEANSKKYHGYTGDMQSVADFIRRYVYDNQRWHSPKYIIGESYGTTRAAAVSQQLIDAYGLYLNGVILVSCVLDFQTLRFEPHNDLPNILFLPTYAAAAYYHQQLAPAQQSRKLEDFLQEVRDFATHQYTIALMRGDLLPEKEKTDIANQIAAYTGLSPEYVLRANLRINIFRFTKELLRDAYEVVGRFDARYKYTDMNANGETGEFDPSYQATILGCFGTAINDYLSRELNFSTHLPYNILTGKVQPWDYSAFTGRAVNTAENLRRTMTMNPSMKLWVANGYYDLATPFFATEYTINHLGLSPALRQNITMTYYPAGHMMYLQKSSLIEMKKHAQNFYKN